MKSDRIIKILAIDDEPDMEELIRQQFRREIRKKEMEFVFAKNGAEALIRLNENKDIDMILSDINMPEMDGLTFLSKLKEINRPLLKTIMVSAYGDMDNIRTAMNRGAFDFVMKPINFDDLEITMNKTIEQVNKLKSAEKDHSQLLSIKHELDVAREIQTSILPKTFPAFPEKTEFDLYAAMDAAKSVGGDFYDFFMIDEERLGLVIADVSGKGIPAALFMAVSRTILKTQAITGLPANECLIRTNDSLCLENANSMFVTVFYAILNIKTGELSYANAGHNPPYILRKNGTVEMLAGMGELVIAVIKGIKYSLYNEKLAPGDVLYLFTDGVTEAMNINDELFNEARLVEVLSQNKDASAKQIIDAIVDKVKDFVNGAEQSDDITALALRYKGKV
ncbi:MAG: SpoIIE family protein phosphatase [Bacteroidetes bacterium]|nr:SpoIIE family protein phosphatase [Bacteroidota bacterium]